MVCIFWFFFKSAIGKINEYQAAGLSELTVEVPLFAKFSVSNLFANETYNVTYSTNKAFGGVNSTDAFRTLLNSVNLFSLSGLNLTVADVDASNGVVHVIDAVILPPSIVKALNGNTTAEK